MKLEQLREMYEDAVIAAKGRPLRAATTQAELTLSVQLLVHAKPFIDLLAAAKRIEPHLGWGEDPEGILKCAINAVENAK